MDKDAVIRSILTVIGGAILGIATTFFMFQGRVSRLETEVEHLKAEVDRFRSTGAIPMTPLNDVIDPKCQGMEPSALIDGTPVPLSSWNPDCTYSETLNGQTVKLSTWGILLEYAGTTIRSARIVAPGETITAPPNSVLFAGYRDSDAVEATYRSVNPTAPTPQPYTK
jgi:hypothetical protein